MTFKYFDTHSHIQISDYDLDREELILGMDASGIGTVAVGVDFESSESAVSLANKYKNVFASVGMHPTDTKDFFEISKFEKLASDERVVSIGECGLDYFRTNDVAQERLRQIPLLETQIDLAVKIQKPLMIHARPSKGTVDAYTDIIEIFKSAKKEHGDKLKGNIHFFVGGIKEARAFFEIDFTVSYTAVITFTHDYDDVVSFAPLSMLLSETDSPFVAPAPNRGARNNPNAVKEVVETLASIRQQDVEIIRTAMVDNASRVFDFNNNTK